MGLPAAETYLESNQDAAVPAASEISEVRLARVDAPLIDFSDDVSDVEEAVRAPLELLDPPLDFAEFVRMRWALSEEATQGLLCGWLRDYEPLRPDAAAE